MKILSLQNKDQNKWINFVHAHEHGSVFHTPFVMNLFERLEGFIPFSLALVGENDEISGLMTGIVQTLKLGILAPLSRRVVSYSTPIFTEDFTSEHMRLLTRKLDEYRAVYTEIRNNYISEETRRKFHEVGYEYEDHLNILIDLTNSHEQLWNDVHSKRRNEIRKAKKEGLTFRVFGEDEVQDAYSILKEVYDRARLPLFPISFFTMGFVTSTYEVGMRGFGAYYGDQMIGCMITLCYKDTIYDFFAGSISKYYSKNPNDLIPWEVFIWGKDHGYKVFDFGGAGKPDQPYGVRDYKLKFGGGLVNYGRYTRIRNKNLYKLAETGFRALQKMNMV